MLYGIAILVFLVIIGVTWWSGIWNIAINLFNFFISALVASNYFEVAADRFETYDNTYTYIADFVCLWAIFVLTFLVMRVFTDILSRYRMKVPTWFEYTGRSVLSIWLACGFICFMFFSLHLAPLAPLDFQPNVREKTLGFGPDRMWLAFVQSRSRGALSESKNAVFGPDYQLLDHPEDEGLDLRVFDPQAKFIETYAVRRQKLSQVPVLRVRK